MKEKIDSHMIKQAEPKPIVSYIDDTQYQAVVAVVVKTYLKFEYLIQQKCGEKYQKFQKQISSMYLKKSYNI